MKKYSKILLISLGIFLIAGAVGVMAQDGEDETPPIVSVIAEPPEVTAAWQKTEALAYVSCVDEEEGSGCDAKSYKLKIYDTAPEDEDCSDDYDDYTFCSGLSCIADNPQTISSHWWLCGAAKDLAGNVSFSSPTEFKVDTTFPTGTISAVPAEVRADEIFSITVSGEDNIDMGAVCYKGENDIDWACHACDGTLTSCSYPFSRSESTLGTYKYYGYVADFVKNGSFTEPDRVMVIVETDPRVSTVSVINLRATQATLNGYIADLGGAKVIEAWFKWGTTTDYGNETKHIAKNNTGFFTDTITNLSPGVVYHFRAVVKNGVGTALGDDMATTELINNGGFETGDLTGWKEVGRPFGKRGASIDDVHEGSYSGLIGFKEGTNKQDGKSGIYQDVSIPSAAVNIELSLWYKFYTTDKCNYDFINIYLKDTSDNILKTYEEWCCQDCSGLNTYGWNGITDGLADWAGQTVRIYFEVENRSDKYHRSWAYIDNVSIKYTPTLPPSVVTRPATSIDTSQAVLNGELIDMGGSDSVETWFVWDFTSHDNWQDYPNKTEPVSQTSIGSFSALIGNLSSGTTYHFRAVAKNSAGTILGDDLDFPTAYSAAGGWICPVNHQDPNNHWSYEERAHDCDILTRAHNGPAGTGWKGFIVFDSVHAVRSNKIRVSATGKGCPSSPCPMADIDILYQGAGTWTHLYEAELSLNHNWIEIPLPSEGMIIKGRFRFYYQKSGWISTLDEFQFYKVPDEPITPPAGNTSEATSVEENSAILHGTVIDDGRELSKFRFQYGKTKDYEIASNPPWETGPGGVGFASGETFGKFISGLEKGVTYHFRAQIKNSAGIASGADKTFYTQSAPRGWVSPQGAYGDRWGDAHFIFDDELGTYARSLKTTTEQWSSYLYLTRPEIYSDKIRFWAHEPYEIDRAIIDVYKDGKWVNVYNGTFADGQWVEATFTGGRVSQARIKFHMANSSHYFYYLVHEFDFWKIAQAPSVLTVATGVGDVGTNQATLKGKLADLGGAHSVDVWFVWDTNDHDNWQDYVYSSYGARKTMTKPGDFEYTIGGLSSATTYHFKAVASSTAGSSSGSDKAFTTLGECVSETEVDCISEQGCGITITCSVEGIYVCPRQECSKGTTGEGSGCLCPDFGKPDECVDADGDGYEDDLIQYQDYGDCDDSCACDTGTDLGQPCAPVIRYNVSGCIINQAPKAKFSCSPSDCSAYSGSADPILTLINKSTDRDGDDDISTSGWDILNYTGDELTCPDRCNYTVQSTLLPPGEYIVELKVIDRAGVSDATTKTIKIKRDAIADFMCSLTESGPWEDCSGFKGIQGEFAYFKDDQSLAQYSLGSETPGGGGTFEIISRTWELNGQVFSSGNAFLAAVKLPRALHTIELTIKDEQGRTDTRTYSDIQVKLPLPTWREIK